MPPSTQQILDLLAEHGIEPSGSDPREVEVTSEVDENEDVFEISVDEILSAGQETASDEQSTDFDPVEALGEYLRARRPPDWHEAQLNRSYLVEVEDAPEPFCAWYCPVHYFGPDWGIYIREDCTIRQAYEIAKYLGRIPYGTQRKIAEDLIRASFYAFYLHEQFHHKVESFSLRLLVSTGKDRYRRYQEKVYVPKYRTDQCIEESLANADSVRRPKKEPRYKKRLSPSVQEALEIYLNDSIPKQPFSYGRGLEFRKDKQYKDGVQELQSQVLTALCPARFSSEHWQIANHMMRSVMDIDRKIYVIVPRGYRPVLPWGHIQPAPTTDSDKLIQACKDRGCTILPGGKGSHTKVKHKNGETSTIPHGKNLRPGTIRSTLKKEGYRLHQLPDFLSGR